MQLLTPTMRIFSYIPPPTYKSLQILTIVPTEIVGKGYGMPSSHAQFVAFFSLSLTLFLMFRHQTTTHTSYRPSTFAERLGLSILACFCAVLVALSRIYLNYHTPKQVWVGFSAGLAFAVVWFAFTSYLRAGGWIEWGLDLAIARQLRFRDLILTEDLQDSGFQKFDAMRMAKRSAPNGSVSDGKVSQYQGSYKKIR